MASRRRNLRNARRAIVLDADDAQADDDVVIAGQQSGDCFVLSPAFLTQY